MILDSKKIINGVGIVIASTNRPEVLAETLVSISSRISVPEIVILSVVKYTDLPIGFESFPINLKIVCGNVSSSSTQRNLGVDVLPKSIEIVVFLDDDMEIHDLSIQEVKNIFARNSELVAFSGCVLANGNISREAARVLLNEHIIPSGMPDYGILPNNWPGLYGCCMCIRRDLLITEPFDENLPLYAIGEDTEIGFRLRKFGKVGGSARCPVVHLAVSSGRVSELGVGYAQVINFVYFALKGIGFPVIKTLWERILLVPGKNLVCWILPFFDKNNTADRKGRFFGNLLALRDIFLLRISPSRLTSHILKNTSVRL